ncbi:MAG: FAD-binding protein [Candidatus Beckwithbacteria bacterium]|nr:FAD-binding protein [Patescibacteria group bacterium]
MTLDLKQNQPMKDHTTFKVGGPAEFFCLAKTVDDLISAAKLAQKNHWPFHILGKGSNVLISDRGLKGLTVINQTDKITILPNEQVELSSGLFLPKAILYLINQGLTGLEVFSGIPATIGGATKVKMHGVGALWEDFIVKVNKYQEIILSVVIQLKKGDKKAALAKVKTIQALKVHQPQISSGCIFKNLSLDQQKKLDLPTPSIGYIMDKVLNLKGITIGQARISLNHAGFIENLGGAKASDIVKLIELMKQSAKDKLDLNLKLEIQTLGF